MKKQFPAPFARAGIIVVVLVALAMLGVVQAQGALWSAKAYVTVTAGRIGDANGDGIVDTGDITKIRRIYFGMDDPTPAADVNQDGIVDTGDITRVKRIYFGLDSPTDCADADGIEALRITKDRYGHCYLKKSGEKYLVGREQKYDIECIVSDTSIELSYEWSCTDGELSGEGPLITWTAPNTAVAVTVTVMVYDIGGNTACKDVTLDVVSCSACTFGC